jgi:hypothetical protein
MVFGKVFKEKVILGRGLIIVLLAMEYTLGLTAIAMKVSGQKASAKEMVLIPLEMGINTLVSTNMDYLMVMANTNGIMVTLIQELSKKV